MLLLCIDVSIQRLEGQCPELEVTVLEVGAVHTPWVSSSVPAAARHWLGS